MTLNERTLTLHGHEIRLTEYVPAPAPPGDTDVVILLHGIAGSSHTWLPLLDHCERHGFGHRILAPDMLGHGASGTPRADYGLGALATVVRDVLALEGHRHATVVGHSLGGGIAMQFAYQFPEMCGRLVLVDSGGLGPEVSPILRATALPGTNATLALLVNRVTLTLARAAAAAGRKLGGRLSPETRELAAHLSSLAGAGRRRAFLSIARGLIDLRGQRASAIDKLYLAAGVPTLVVWGERDKLIPLAHGRRTATLMPGSKLEVFEKAKHFPHVAEPARFQQLLSSFLAENPPARLNFEEVVRLLVASNSASAH